MKIICVDNFDRDYISDRLVKENVSKYEGGILVQQLNDKQSSYSPNYYKLVEDDHHLRIFEP